MLKYSERRLALNTLIYSKYHRRIRVPDSEAQEPVPDRKEGHSSTHHRRTAGTHPKSNYELFNCNNLNIRYWSWNYRGCWHQTCPPMEFVKGFRLYSFQLPDIKCPVLLFIVTTSPYQDWVICAPAAFLGCGSRFSGSLSGIEP